MGADSTLSLGGSMSVHKKERLDSGAALACPSAIQSISLGFGMIYPQLRAIASAMMSHQRSAHTLQPTAVVSEAFLRLVHRDGTSFQSEAHLLAYAATVMRSVLVDHSRKRRSKKRGGGAQVSSEALLGIVGQVGPGVDFLEIDDALCALESADERVARVVEARIFGGLTIEEVAEALHISLSSVARDWRFGRAFLAGQLSCDGTLPELEAP